MKTSNPLVDARMVELYRQGLSTGKIARVVGRDQSGVYRALERLGVLERRRHARSANVDRYVALHERGLSTRQISELEGVKKNTVIQALRWRRKLRQAPGRDIEREVAAWTIGFARTCFQTKGDRPYDLLVDGVRVEVISARVSRDRGYDRYYFAINHLESNPNRSENIDEYYLVLLSEPGRPIYSVPASAVKVKRTMSVSSDIDKSKYPLRLLGYLDAEVQSGGEAV